VVSTTEPEESLEPVVTAAAAEDTNASDVTAAAVTAAQPEERNTSAAAGRIQKRVPFLVHIGVVYNFLCKDFISKYFKSL